MIAATTVLLLFTSLVNNNLQNEGNVSTVEYLQDGSAENVDSVNKNILDTKFRRDENEEVTENVVEENSFEIETNGRYKPENIDKQLITVTEDGQSIKLETSKEEHLENEFDIEGNEKAIENMNGKKVANDTRYPELQKSTCSTNETAETTNKTRVFPKQNPVKFNLKQGVIMEQILSVYSLTNSKNETCRKQSQEFQVALRAFEPWALKMFDSSSKLQSGILAGNFLDYGSFKQCIEIHAATGSGTILGKHCLVRIRPTESIIRKMLSFRNFSTTRFDNVREFLKDASVYWSVCVPNSCTNQDVSEHFTKVLPSLTEGLDVEVSLDDTDCNTKEDETQPFSAKERITAYGILAYLSFIFVCTVLDVYQGTNSARLTKIFSMYSNLIYITSDRPDTDGLSCLHGIRFLSIVLVVFGHKFVMALFFPFFNTFDILDFITTYPSTLVTGSTVSVDSFFLLSGLLVSYHFFEQMSKGGKFSLPSFYLHRYLRITPSFAVIILIITVFGDRFGSGPLWKKVWPMIVEPCESYWWAGLTYIQCYTNPRFSCIIQTWYLNADMQYYFCSPILLLTTWKWKKCGLSLLSVLTVLSLLTNFYIAWSNEFPVASLIDNTMPKSDYLANYYMLPHIRASPYFIGIAMGYILHKTKNDEKKTSFGALVLGWTVSCTTFLAVIFGNLRYQAAEYVYEALEASLFMMMSRLVWTLALAWLIWTCRDGYGGPVNAFLSAPIFQKLSKITYAIFLVHMPIQFFGGATSKAASYFSGYNLFHAACGDLFAILIFALLLTILVEMPIYRTSLLLFKSGGSKISPTRSKR